MKPEKKTVVRAGADQQSAVEVEGARGGLSSRNFLVTGCGQVSQSAVCVLQVVALKTKAC